MSIEKTQHTNPVLQAVIVVRQLSDKPGQGAMLAHVNPKNRASVLVDEIPARVEAACEWWATKGDKILKKGCELEVTVSHPLRKGQSAKDYPLPERASMTAAADPKALGVWAAKMARDCISNMKAPSEDTASVKDVMGDVVNTSAEFVSSAYAYLPQIHAAANGDPQALLMATGKAMMQDPEGQKQFGEVVAAASGSQEAISSLKAKAQDMPFGGIFNMFLDHMAQNAPKK